ncbi:MAG: NAD(P)/FAD-dependent oxidoreductase [Bacteroidia bacterium]
MKAYTVVIIGTGFGGQASAINLLKNNIHDFCILERRNFMGGTWCQNTYPGAAVDVQSPLYSLSFEPYKWSQMFVEQSELEQYTHFVINKYKLREKIFLNTNVESVKWIEIDKVWEITTNHSQYYAKFIINASGPLSTPVIPDFKGKDSFKGTSFHTNNWDSACDYKNKRVAIIGSGASAAQVIPTIAPDVKELHVFQRTPHWVMPRPDRKFTPGQQKLLGNRFFYEFLRKTIYWSLETRMIAFKYSRLMLKLVGERAALNFIKKSFPDNELRKKVTPDYLIGCKRIILSNTLYPALCRNNVTLYSREQGIKEITEKSIITQDGKEIELDLIVYSTGYDATDNVIAYPLTGRENYSLQTFWKDYPRAYLGTAMPKFPNLFVITGPNTGIGHTSAIFIIEAQLLYIIKSIKKVIESKKQSIEVTVEAEQKYTAMIHREMKPTVWHSGGCKSWYQSKSGHVIAMFPGFSFTFRSLANNFKPEDHIIS